MTSRNRAGAAVGHCWRRSSSAKLGKLDTGHGFQREKHGVEEEVMENPMRASGWPDMARRRAVRSGTMDGLGGVLGEEPTVHDRTNQRHGKKEGVTANLPRPSMTAQSG